MNQCLNCRGCPGLNSLPNTGIWQNWGDDYTSVVNDLQNIELLIVGQDPYRTRATGIAFCKPTWHELLDDQYCALTLFCSLGINLKKASFDVSRFPTPKEFFIWLAGEHRVVFVNALIKKTKKRENDIHNTNAQTWLNKAKYSILCGKNSQTSSRVNEDANHIYVDHPSGLNRLNPLTSSKWLSTWGHCGSLLDTIKGKCQTYNSLQSYEDIRTIVNKVNQEL